MTRTTLFLSLAGAALSGGCAHQAPAHFSPPSTSAVRHDVSVARTAVAAAKGQVTTAQANLTTAQTQAKTIAASAPEALQPQVRILQVSLDAASSDLAQALEQASGAETALAASDQHAGELQVKIDGQTEQLNRERDEKNRVIVERDQAKAGELHQTALAWKWRLIALGELACVAAFFVARQYLPFLKLI